MMREGRYENTSIEGGHLYTNVQNKNGGAHTEGTGADTCGHMLCGHMRTRFWTEDKMYRMRKRTLIWNEWDWLLCEKDTY